jgi:hypothetical protein
MTTKVRKRLLIAGGLAMLAFALTLLAGFVYFIVVVIRTLQAD